MAMSRQDDLVPEEPQVCKHILVFFDSCGHREDRIEHIRGCETDNRKYFEVFPTTLGNFLPPDESHEYEPERVPTRHCLNPICKTEIQYQKCHSCQVIDRYIGAAGPHPYRLPEAEMEERRLIFDRTQGERNPEALAKRIEKRAERYWAAFEAYKAANAEDKFFVEAEGDISTSQERFLKVIDQTTLTATDGDCPICNLPITEPGGFAPDDTPETATEIRQLPCEHNFHIDCIKTWLNEHHNCPLCRKKWLWYNLPTPSWEDPVFEWCFIAPGFARQVSGHVPFYDPMKPIPFGIKYLNLTRAEALFGRPTCTLNAPPMDGEGIEGDVRLAQDLIDAGLAQHIAHLFPLMFPIWLPGDLEE